MQVKNKVRYPGAGCIVEFMQGNAHTIAIVIDEQAGRLRLFTHGKKEVKLAQNRLLPWAGPQVSASLNRAEMSALLEEHRAKRAEIASSIDIGEVWELAEGEVEKATATWFASLLFDELTVDIEAAMGHALLAYKSHFKFSPPDFEIFTREKAAQRVQEAEAERLRESVVNKGTLFFHKLYEIYLKKRNPLSEDELPEPDIAEKLKGQIFATIVDEAPTDDVLWKQLVKGLPQDPFLALHLAEGWGLVPEHYNFYLDRAGYDSGSAWAEPFADEITAFIKNTHLAEQALPQEASAEFFEERHQPFYVSVDPQTTKDRDDAFYVAKKTDGSFLVSIAVACPSLCWPFGSAFDKCVLRRSSSIYLPEGDEHMLPESIGWQVFSLDEGQPRPAFIIDMLVSADGRCQQVQPRLQEIIMGANLSLEQCESVLETCLASAANPLQAGVGAKGEGVAGEGLTAGESAVPGPAVYAAHERAETDQTRKRSSVLQGAYELAQLLQKARLENGAVIIEKPDSLVTLTEGENGPEVTVTAEFGVEKAHFTVGEIMVLANSAITEWAVAKGIPLFFRTQDVALPREYANIWREPHEIARVIRSLAPAILEVQPKRHAGLGVSAYATVTSPIRRYIDLINQRQIAGYLQEGEPLFTREELSGLLPLLHARGDAVSQIQRFRPRYWKLLFFKQKGDKEWWEGTITEENDAFATVSLPFAQLFVRGKRRLFAEKTYPGQTVAVRIGKVNPLLNEISILEVEDRSEDVAADSANLFL